MFFSRRCKRRGAFASVFRQWEGILPIVCDARQLRSVQPGALWYKALERKVGGAC